MAVWENGQLKNNVLFERISSAMGESEPYIYKPEGRCYYTLDDLSELFTRENLIPYTVYGGKLLAIDYSFFVNFRFSGLVDLKTIREIGNLRGWDYPVSKEGDLSTLVVESKYLDLLGEMPPDRESPVYFAIVPADYKYPKSPCTLDGARVDKNRRVTLIIAPYGTTEFYVQLRVKQYYQNITPKYQNTYFQHLTIKKIGDVMGPPIRSEKYNTNVFFNFKQAQQPEITFILEFLNAEDQSKLGVTSYSLNSESCTGTGGRKRTLQESVRATSSAKEPISSVAEIIRNLNKPASTDAADSFTEPTSRTDSPRVSPARFTRTEERAPAATFRRLSDVHSRITIASKEAPPKKTLTERVKEADRSSRQRRVAVDTDFNTEALLSNFSKRRRTVDRSKEAESPLTNKK